MRNANKGFTLLELLMVVIIIAILASLALPGYYRAVERSRGAEATTVLGQVRSAFQRYCLENNGVLPTTFANFDIENPAVQANRQWDYAFPTLLICPTATDPLNITIVATRRSGPCGGVGGSTITLTDTGVGIVGAPLFSYSWTGPCS